MTKQEFFDILSEARKYYGFDTDLMNEKIWEDLSNKLQETNHASISPEFQHQINLLNKRINELTGKLKYSADVPQKDWYRPTEVCKILGISRTKFETLKRSGVFVPQKIGSGVYISANDLTAYLPKPNRS